MYAINIAVRLPSTQSVGNTAYYRCCASTQRLPLTVNHYIPARASALNSAPFADSHSEVLFFGACWAECRRCRCHGPQSEVKRYIIGASFH